MTEISPRERPRERLQHHGADALATNELLAIILGEGVHRRNALELATDVLAEVGGVDGLARTSHDQLRQRKGVGCARAGRIIAAIELGRRTLLPPATERLQLLTPRDVATLLAPEFGACAVERFGVVLLDVKHRVRRTLVLSSGSVDATCVSMCDVFHAVLVEKARAIVAFHNHPSGDPTPSPEDRELTERLHRAADLLGIEFLDHVILANDKYYSFRESAQPTEAEPVRKRKRLM